MRSFLRVLLFLPMLAALLGFASVHYETSTEGGVRVHELDIGAVDSWFTYRSESDHDGGAAQAIGDPLEDHPAAGEPSTGTHLLKLRSATTSTVRPLTWSMGFGVLLVVNHTVPHQVNRSV